MSLLMLKFAEIIEFERLFRVLNTWGFDYLGYDIRIGGDDDISQ
jgi:hypothetical protein